MKCKLFQLQDRLKQHAPQVALISGNEPLLVQQAARLVRKAAHQAGAKEHVHKLLLCDEDIVQVLTDVTTGSLFADKRLCEVSCKFERNNSKIPGLLHKLAEVADDTTRVLFVCDKLDKTAAAKPWVRHIETQGLWVEVWPLSEQEHRKWLQQRLSNNQLEIAEDALQALFELTVGNLVSADQEIRKLTLLHPKGHFLSHDDILSSTADSARFSMFSLVDDALLGKHDRTVHGFRQLLLSGIKPIEVAGQISRVLYEVLHMSQALVDQQDRREVVRKLHIFPAKLAVYEQALRRLQYPQLVRLLRYATALDSLLKGLRKGNDETAVQALLLAVAGKQTPALALLNPRLGQ